MRRVVVIGTSGSGKTSLARRLAVGLDAPVIELDAAYHQPDWKPPDRDAFRRRIETLTRGVRWVVDGNYTSVVGDIVWSAADTVVWVDPSRRAVLAQVCIRTLGRTITGRELWNGNREHWQNLLRRDPEENIVKWAWTTYEPNRRRYEAAMVDPQWDHLRFVRIRTRAEADRFLESAATNPDLSITRR